MLVSGRVIHGISKIYIHNINRKTSDFSSTIYLEITYKGIKLATLVPHGKVEKSPSELETGKFSYQTSAPSSRGQRAETPFEHLHRSNVLPFAEPLGASLEKFKDLQTQHLVVW